jgi:uncharacterized protein (TIGR03067 family)
MAHRRGRPWRISLRLTTTPDVGYLRSEHRMRKSPVAVSLAGLVLLIIPRFCAAQPNADDPKLQGDWRVLSVFRDGSPSLASDCFLKVLIYDNRIVFKSLSHSADSYTLRIDASKNPKNLETEWDIRPYGDVIVGKGIYEIVKGRLRICIGDPRPTAFETKPKDGRTLFVLERDDTDEPTPSASAVAKSREAIIRKIIASLPNGWRGERGPTSLVLRRAEEPVIVNLFQLALSDIPNPGETHEEWARRHAVNIKYRITLRFVPKLSSARVHTMAAENQESQREIKKIWAESYSREEYPSADEAKTAEEKTTLERYVRLHQSLHTLPDGYSGDVSIYVMPTKLVYASFLRKQDRAECERTIKQVISLCDTYSLTPDEAANKE